MKYLKIITKIVLVRYLYWYYSLGFHPGVIEENLIRELISIKYVWNQLLTMYVSISVITFIRCLEMNIRNSGSIASLQLCSMTLAMEFWRRRLLKETEVISFSNYLSYPMELAGKFTLYQTSDSLPYCCKTTANNINICRCVNMRNFINLTLVLKIDTSY